MIASATTTAPAVSEDRSAVWRLGTETTQPTHDGRAAGRHRTHRRRMEQKLARLQSQRARNNRSPALVSEVIMKIIFPLVALLSFPCGGRAAEPEFLKQALVTLSPRWLADIPLAKRELLLREMRGEGTRDRVDYKHDWAHWYSDGSEVGGTSQFRLKLLPREGDTPLVFVHMGKPFATGAAPAKEHTVILKLNGKDWEDVTESLWPKEVDRTMHFAPQRETNVIEVKAWKAYKTQGGQVAPEGDPAYSYGETKWEMVWGGRGGFQVREPAKKPAPDQTPAPK